MYYSRVSFRVEEMTHHWFFRVLEVIGDQRDLFEILDLSTRSPGLSITLDIILCLNRRLVSWLERRPRQGLMAGVAVPVVRLAGRVVAGLQGIQYLEWVTLW